jgi:putative transposase
MRHRDKMTYDPAKHHRRSIRLRGYDYRQPGAYFVTIVCKDRALILEDPQFRAAVEEAWLCLADQYGFVQLDEFVIMPNHLHAIIFIRSPRRGASRGAPTDAPKRKPLGQLIGAFKTASTKRINQIRGTPGLPIWQRNYYEHVIRHERELDAVRRYIEENPLRWDQDPENPALAQAVGDHRGLPLHPNGDPP